MQFSIKKLMGVTLIVAILSFLFRRLFIHTDIWHAALAPFYYDLYLFGLEGLWNFDGSVFEKINTWRENKAFSDFPLFFTFTISWLIFAIIHIFLGIYICCVIHKFFFIEETNENS